MPRGRSRWLLSAVALALVLLLLWWLWPRQAAESNGDGAEEVEVVDGILTLSAEQADALDLQTTPAEAAGVIPVSGLAAEAMAPLHASARVASPYAGVVARVLVDDGAMVRRGDPVVRIQSLDWLTAQADLARARSDAEVAGQQAQRDATLFAEGIISSARSQQSRAQAAAADASRRQTEGALSGLRPVAGGAAGEFELLSPIDGQVLQRSVMPGQSLQALEHAFTIAEPGALDIVFNAPIELLPQLRTGLRVLLPGGEGEVVAVGAGTDRASQTLRLRAQAGAGTRLVAGQQFGLTLLLPAPDGSVSLPGNALIAHGDTHVVYVEVDPARDDAGTGHRRRYHAVPVQRLGGDGSTVVVTGDLAPGMAVVSSGASALKPLLATE